MNLLNQKTDMARDLRQRETPSEKIVWDALRSSRLNNCKFRRQHPVPQTRFVADFCCPALKLIVEIDGGYHDEPEQMERDEDRQRLIAEFGYTFVRVKDTDVIMNLPVVLQTIQNTIQTLMSNPNCSGTSALPSKAKQLYGVGAPNQ